MNKMNKILLTKSKQNRNDEQKTNKTYNERGLSWTNMQTQETVGREHCAKKCVPDEYVVQNKLDIKSEDKACTRAVHR